jgi:hypothetical protein
METISNHAYRSMGKVAFPAEKSGEDLTFSYCSHHRNWLT